MAWGFRKSFGFGPFRLNLSKGGVGASVGVRGARVGINSRGKGYSHLSAGGLFVRNQLGTGEPSSTQPSALHLVPTNEPPQNSNRRTTFMVVALLVVAWCALMYFAASSQTHRSSAMPIATPDRTTSTLNSSKRPSTVPGRQTSKRAGGVYVQGYYRKNGTYVRGHYRKR